MLFVGRPRRRRASSSSSRRPPACRSWSSATGRCARPGRQSASSRRRARSVLRAARRSSLPFAPRGLRRRSRERRWRTAAPVVATAWAAWSTPSRTASPACSCPRGTRSALRAAIERLLGDVVLRDRLGATARRLLESASRGRQRPRRRSGLPARHAGRGSRFPRRLNDGLSSLNVTQHRGQAVRHEERPGLRARAFPRMAARDRSTGSDPLRGRRRHLQRGVPLARGRHSRRHRWAERSVELRRSRVRGRQLARRRQACAVRGRAR